MKRFEYRIAEIFFKRGESKDQRLLNTLNALGREGWHVTLIESEPHRVMSESSIRIWLEREVEGQAAA